MEDTLSEIVRQIAEFQSYLKSSPDGEIPEEAKKIALKALFDANTNILQAVIALS